MRGVWVRYRDGSTEEWKVKEAMRLAKLAELLRSAFRNSGRISLAVASPERDLPTDLDIVGINMADVVAWRVIGLDQPHQEAALWNDLDRLFDVGEENSP